MGVIEDTRKVLQAFLAPELRVTAVRLDALEKKADENEKRAESRHSEVLSSIRQIMDYNSIQVRPAKLESQKEVAHQ